MANMSNFANTPILLHGIGKGVFKTVSGKIRRVEIKERDWAQNEKN